jgi:CRISPR system Cascade subunit CasD
MSSSLHLGLRLCAPLQSWGSTGVMGRRPSELFPTHSAIAGLCCAALGYERGSAAESQFLHSFSSVRMTAISLYNGNSKRRSSVGRVEDFQTAEGTLRADGSNNANQVITRKQYLTDGNFAVLLEGNADVLRMISSALQNPKWGLWLGRKSCPPSRPIFASIDADKSKVLECLLGRNAKIEDFWRCEESEGAFEIGGKILRETAVSFALGNRVFAARRTVFRQPKHQT